MMIFTRTLRIQIYHFDMKVETIEVEVGKVHDLESLTHVQMSVLVSTAKGMGVARMAGEGIGSYPSLLRARDQMYDIFNVKSEVMLVHAAVLNGVIKIEVK